MRTSERRAFARLLALAVVAGVHVLYLEIFMLGPRKVASSAQTQSQPLMTLYWVELPQQPDSTVEEEPLSSAPNAPRAPARPPPPGSTAISVPSVAEHSPEPAAIDWYAAVEDHVQDDLDEALQPGPRAFGEHPNSPYKRKPRKPQTQWEPEEKRAGFAGPLPYVRVGRCVIGLPFFACPLGKKEKPNGITLEEMRDPDRPRSSVPDPDE